MSGRPTPLEIACGTALGFDDTVGELPPPGGVSVRLAIAAELRTALARPPCGVSFSGGRDSSTVLALATDVARREGLPDPVPVTLSFPDDPQSAEREWQELVVGHLRLPDWRRLEFRGEMDVLGPIAAPVLRALGVTVPFNVYFHEPVLRELRGGSLVTGIGGDELLSAGLHHRANLVATRRERPRPADLARLAAAAAPEPLRRAAVRARLREELEPLPWLRPDAAAEVTRSWVEGLGRESISHATSVRRVLWPDRGRRLGLAALDRLGAAHDVVCHSPFSAGPVLAAAVAQQRWRDFTSRRAAVADLLAGLLPDDVAGRSTKAVFPATFFNRHARAFVRAWDGTLPPELDALADPSVLQRMWSDEAEQSDARTFGVLQAAWLLAQ